MFVDCDRSTIDLKSESCVVFECGGVCSRVTRVLERSTLHGMMVAISRLKAERL
jgi:hypothetical protein